MTFGNDNGADGQTDGQTECDANAAPPREEGRIIIRTHIAEFGLSVAIRYIFFCNEPSALCIS